MKQTIIKKESKRKIQVKSIILIRREGPTHLCDKPKEFLNEFLNIHNEDEKEDQWNKTKIFREANYELDLMSLSCSKGGGYDKVSFVVTYEDGEEYNGRFDMTYNCSADIGRQMTGYMRHLAKTNPESCFGKFLTQEMIDSAKTWTERYEVYERGY